MRIYPAETGAGGRGEEQKDRKSAAESACREEKSDGGSFFSMRGTGAQTAFVGCRKRRTEARGKRLCFRFIRQLGLAVYLAGTVFFRRCAGPEDAAFVSASDDSVFFFPHARNRRASCFRGLPTAPSRSRNTK